MNKQRVNEIILSPESLKYNTDLGVVNELIQSFPYFSTPYIMLSKMLHDENSIYFDKNLKISAAYAGDREILYNYIKTKEKAQIISEQPAAPEQFTTPEIKENPAIQLSSEPVLADPVSLSLHSDIQPPKGKTDRTLSLDLLQYPITDYFGQYYKKNKKPVETEVPIVKEIQDPLAGKKSFSGWLDALDSIKKDSGTVIKEESEKDEIAEPNDLISNFIKTEPKIRPQQSKMYKPEDMAKLSVVEDHQIATETLANIYLKQGLKSRALEIFQQLILKYPEKSAYFAEKISEIQSEGTF